MRRIGGIPLIRSELYGDKLLAFYQAVATSLGCTSKLEMIPAAPFNTRVQVTLSCSGAAALISADTGYDFYSIFAAAF